MDEMKKFVAIVVVIIAVIVAVICGVTCMHQNDIQEFQVVQAMNGETRIQSDGGIYFQVMPKIWTYKKVNSVFFSNEEKESKDKDGIEVIFSNKGRGDISSQVVYRLYTDQENIMKMHQYAAGNIDIIDNLILSKLKDISMEHASNITSSQAVEDREQLAINIRKDIVNNKQLAAMGIIVEQFSITKINFDEKTNALFAKQQEADLQKKTAEAEKQKLIMEKERTVADYEKQIAEAKGKAETEMMKATTDAERQKKLAEIEASKKVEVEKLAKEEALVKAQKQLELAEIVKKEETIKLETIKIQAEQKVAEAKAKEQQIKLSGAISEDVKYRLDTEKETRIGVAKAIADGLSQTKLPQTLIVGGTGKENGNNTPLDYLIQLLTIEKAKSVATPIVK